MLEQDELKTAMLNLNRVVRAAEFDEPHAPQAVFTTLATLWLMIMQRLGGGLSMKAVLRDVLDIGEDIFPDCKRVRERNLSARDTAFSDARQRLSLDTVTKLLERVGESIAHEYVDATQRHAFIIDGTTLTTAPTDDLREAFPPATNQHGTTVWPVVMMLTAHEFNSGCCMVPEIGAMYGDDRTSEAKMLDTLIRRLPAQSILLADAGFGTFGPVWDSILAGHSIAYRLKKSQFNSLIKNAAGIEDDTALKSRNAPGESFEVSWKPTKKNRNTRPELPDEAVVDVVVHRIPVRDLINVPSTKELYLVTTPDITRAEAIELYQHRYDIEHDIRDIKVTLNTERIRAHSRDMFVKELFTSLVAYNLVVQFRREAAAIADVPPRRLSFTGALYTFQSYFLKRDPPRTVEDWVARYDRALEMASRDVIRERPGRSYKRAAQPRRPKTTKWMKKQRLKKKKLPPN